MISKQYAKAILKKNLKFKMFQTVVSFRGIILPPQALEKKENV